MATTDRAACVVCDAGPLIHLDELGALPLLADFARVLVPDAVWLEVERHRPNVTGADGIALVRTTAPAPGPALAAVARLLSLHAGELQALALCESHAVGLLLTDDTAARLAAGHLGIAVHGTLGVLLRAIRRQQSSPAQVLHWLRSIPARSTLHIKPSLLAEAIEQVERLRH